MKVHGIRESAESGEKGTTGPGELGTCGMKVRGIRESAESDEKGTTGPGELGTCGTKSSDGPEKNGLR
ncbi:hypothetical protein KI387_031739, partial [Taxus chinensis]